MNTKTKDYIEPVKSQISDTMDQVQNRVSDAANKVSDTAKNVSYATDRYVRDNPWKTVAIVALASCLVGWFLSSARD